MQSQRRSHWEPGAALAVALEALLLAIAKQADIQQRHSEKQIGYGLALGLKRLETTAWGAPAGRGGKSQVLNLVTHPRTGKLMLTVHGGLAKNRPCSVRQSQAGSAIAGGGNLTASALTRFRIGFQAVAGVARLRFSPTGLNSGESSYPKDDTGLRFWIQSYDGCSTVVE